MSIYRKLNEEFDNSGCDSISCYANITANVLNEKSLVGSVIKGAGIGMGAGMVARGGKNMYDNYKKNKETGSNDSLVKGIGKEMRKGAGEGAFIGAAAGGVGHYGKKHINTIKSKFKK